MNIHMAIYNITYLFLTLKRTSLKVGTPFDGLALINEDVTLEYIYVDN